MDQSPSGHYHLYSCQIELSPLEGHPHLITLRYSADGRLGLGALRVDRFLSRIGGCFWFRALYSHFKCPVSTGLIACRIFATNWGSVSIDFPWYCF